MWSPVCLQMVFEVRWVGEGPVAGLVRAAVDSGLLLLLGLTAVDVVSAVACVSGQLSACGGDQTVVSQLLDPQVPRRSAIISAVSGRNLLLRLVHIVLNEDQRLGRQPCNTSTASPLSLSREANTDVSKTNSSTDRSKRESVP